MSLPEDQSAREELDREFLVVAEHLARASSVLFVTGAGISADSGLPTYRGIGGLYEREITEEGVPIEDALSGAMLRSDPAICWKYIHQIEAACRGAKPNRAHEIMAELEKRIDRVCILTQNVDGFHRAAGSQNLIEIHGEIHDLFCVSCDHRERVKDYSEVASPPVCPRCGDLIRPAVVLFGEMLPEVAVTQLREELSRGFDVVFSIGTTSVFPYIAEPVHLARASGRMTVEINPAESEISHVVDHRFRAGSRDVLEILYPLYLLQCQKQSDF